MLKAPNQNLMSFEIQKFRNLPRYGEPSTYCIYDGTNGKAVDDEIELQVKDKITEIGDNVRRYYHLLEMKFMGNYYNKMQLDLPTNIKSSNKSSENKIAQNYLLQLGYMISAKEAFPNYFCNRSQKCEESKRRFGEFPKWGGLLADEFESIECYRKFINDNFSDLKTWSNQLTNDGYFVQKVVLESYDFTSQGFPVDIYPTAPVEGTVGAFIPKQDYEKWMRIPNAGIIRHYKGILKVPQAEAKPLIEKTKRTLYAVYKIQYYGMRDNFKELSSAYRNFNNVDFLYNLVSPTVELFVDDSLTKKIGEITIQQSK